jgi:hypothetical protein
MANSQRQRRVNNNQQLQNRWNFRGSCLPTMRRRPTTSYASVSTVKSKIDTTGPSSTAAHPVAP